jgi:MFS transporter, MCT family, solute carrier family 16 (monocarboxylic acid transporters), member 12
MYVPAIVIVGLYFEKKRSLAMGIAVCGSGVGTFIMSPLNHFLYENFGRRGAFLIKAAFILNGCVCGALMRPVAIEQVEITKRKKSSLMLELENFSQNKRKQLLKSQGHNSLKEIIKTSFDPTLLMDLVFILYSLSNFLTSLGFNTPYIYIVDHAISCNIEDSTADWILSIVGLSNVVGRIVFGLISDIRSIKRIYVYSLLLTVCGIATVLEPFPQSLGGFIAYAIVFGITSGNYFRIIKHIKTRN